MRPALEHPNVTLLTNAQRAGARDQRRRAPRSPRSWSSATASARAFAADIVVVSCGAANSAKLLLASANDKHPNGLANGSDQVGRNYMFHNSQAVLALSKEANPTVFQKTLGLNDFYFGERRLRVPAGQHPDGRQVVRRRCTAARSRSRPSSRRTWTLEERRPPRRRLLALDRGPAAAREPGHARPRRQRHGSATRRPTRSPTKQLYHQLKSMLGAPRHAPGPPDPAPRLPEERHPGRRRAPTRPAPAASAPTPTTSVLERDCKAHELDNLYVVDTSFFPSIGAVNPALTAMANALRVGDHLLERLGAQRPRGSRAWRLSASGGRRRRVVIVGGGFGGLAAARELRRADVDVTLVDRDEPPPVPAAALPGRGGRRCPRATARRRSARRLKRSPNASVLMAEVTDVDVERRAGRPRPRRAPRLRQPDRRLRRADVLLRPRRVGRTSRAG